MLKGPLVTPGIGSVTSRPSCTPALNEPHIQYVTLLPARQMPSTKKPYLAGQHRTRCRSGTATQSDIPGL